MPRVPGWTMAVVVIVASAIAIAGVRHAMTSSPKDERPVTLPATFAGLTPRTPNFGTETSWISTARDATGGAPILGTTYGKVGEASIINVVVARSDLTGDLDQDMAGDDGELLGATRCTRKVMLTVDKDKKPIESTKMLLCWRTSDLLSVTALVLSRPPEPAEVAAAVDAVWEGLR
jgi:hypothetical protein